MKAFRYALRQIIPLLFSIIPVGLAFGILFSSYGYSALWTLAAAALIYAGSMQIVMVPMLVSGAPLLTTALMTLFVNARHVFYGIGFVERFRGMGWKSPYMALTLSDEPYSVLCAAQYPDDIDGRSCDFYVLLLCHTIWIASCVTGAVAGGLLPFDTAGIEFTATAFFTTVVVGQWKQRENRMPAMVGLGCALAARLLLGADRFILPALTLSAALLTAGHLRAGRRKGGAGRGD